MVLIFTDELFILTWFIYKYCIFLFYFDVGTRGERLSLRNQQSKQLSGKERVEPEEQTIVSEKKAKKISSSKKVPSTKKEDSKVVKEAKRKGIIYYLNVYDK